MTDPVPTCFSRGCTAPADLAIRTTNPARKNGLLVTMYLAVEDAPKSALAYCVRCGMHLAAELARLSNVEDAPLGGS